MKEGEKHSREQDVSLMGIIHTAILVSGQSGGNQVGESPVELGQDVGQSVGRGYGVHV